MAEATLSVDRDEILQAVGDYLGYTRNQHVWTREQTARVDGIVRSGERQFYNPPPLGNFPPHTWSFLRPLLRTTISAPYDTGTIECVSGVVTLTSGTFPSWAADGYLVADGGGYRVDTRDGNTQVTLDDTSIDIAALTEYSLQRWQYTLPDDFGGFINPTLNFISENNKIYDVRRVSVQEILAMRQREQFAVAYQPMYASDIPVNSTSATEGQRFELLLFPTPVEAGYLEAQYFAVQDQASSSYPFAKGGGVHGETLLAACMAAAEMEKDKRPGAWKQQFIERLAASVAHDRKTMPRNLGFNYGDCDFETVPRVRAENNYYNDTLLG